MQLLNFKNIKILVLNFIIIIALGLFSVLMLKEKSQEGIYGLILIATMGVFQNVIKTYKDEENNKKITLINMFIESFIYVILYGLILFIFKIEIILCVKIIITQLFLIVYSIAKDYVTFASNKKQVVFYILFFSFLIGGGIYGLNSKISFLDILLYSIALASSASAIYCTFIKLDTK